MYYATGECDPDIPLRECIDEVDAIKMVENFKDIHSIIEAQLRPTPEGSQPLAPGRASRTRGRGCAPSFDPGGVVAAADAIVARRRCCDHSGVEGTARLRTPGARGATRG